MPQTFDGNRLIIIDGDTIALPCSPQTGFHRGCAAKVRIAGIDTPETRKASCDNEYRLGLLARERLREYLRNHEVAILATGETDPYGRTLATLLTDSINVGEAMIESGNALPWRAGAKARALRKSVWCGGSRS